MKPVGIIAEYNPLHNGHVYQLEEAKRLAGTDAAVIAMSGNFVQRGEPAILDKWTRAAEAVSCGASLVVEIPTLFCLSNAGQYGKAGVKLIEALGCVSHLAFGSESGDIEALRRVAARLSEPEFLSDPLFDECTRKGLNYPAARLLVYRNHYSESSDCCDDISILGSSNDILALEYLNSLQTMEPLAVKRAGSVYSSGFINESEFQSASALRKCLADGICIKDYVPVRTYNDLLNQDLCFPDMFMDLLKFTVLSSSAEDFDACPSGGEGIGNRLKENAGSCRNFEELVLSAKSKRYTYTRISRLLMQLLLGIRKEKFSFERPEYIRVLAADARGRELLAQIRDEESCSLPIISNLSKMPDGMSECALKSLELDVKAYDIYNLAAGTGCHARADYRRHPAML